MKVESTTMVPLGYGKYFRSDYIVGLVPIEDDRGPGRRTFVYIQGQREPFVASRSDSAILRDMRENPAEFWRSREQEQLLADILDTVEGIDPMLRTIISNQGNWNLDRLEERIRDTLSDLDDA
jgi:hypothetical protein